MFIEKNSKRIELYYRRKDKPEIFLRKQPRK